MKISASIELVMQFATYEAVAGQFREVEPEHMLMALLKFPELPVEEMEKLAPGAGAKQIAKEVDTVCKELSRRVIGSKKARRELRARMGRGNSPFSGGRIHRSAAGRQIFDVAGKLADDAGSEAIAAGHILEALMIAPTRLIEQVLGDAVGAKVRERKDTPLLNEYGKDLTQLATEGKLPPVSGRIAECKALVEALKQSDRRSVLLISDNDQVVESIVFAAARAIGNENWVEDLKGRRIIDVTGIRPSGQWDRQTRERFGKILTEAAAVEDIILFVPPIEVTAGTDTPDEWFDFLQKTLSKGSIQCICRTTSEAYRNWIQKNTIWKRLASAIWIHDEIEDEVPWEL
jgi:ATP-dependent Clp protease ATP-binding subunit ClpC